MSSARAVVFCAGREPASVPTGTTVVRLGPDPMDYARALAWWWTEPYDLLTIEHDMRVTDAAVTAVTTPLSYTDDPDRCAAIPYVSYPIKTGLPHDIWSAWNPGTVDHFVSEGAPDASHTALGCTYFPQRHLARRYNLPEPFPHWTRCDTWISRHVARYDSRPRPFRLVWGTDVTHEVPTAAWPT